MSKRTAERGQPYRTHLYFRPWDLGLVVPSVLCIATKVAIQGYRVEMNLEALPLTPIFPIFSSSTRLGIMSDAFLKSRKVSIALPPYEMVAAADLEES